MTLLLFSKHKNKLDSKCNTGGCKWINDSEKISNKLIIEASEVVI